MINLSKKDGALSFANDENQTITIGQVPLETLSAMDYYFLLDISYSMTEPSHRIKGKTRFQEVREDVRRFAGVAEKFDDDGITLISFNGDTTVYDGVRASKVDELFNTIRPNGSTDLAKALKKAIEMAKNSKKDAVIAVYTDGQPTDSEAVIKVVNEAGLTLGRPKINIVIVQIGLDKKATKFLDYLDNSLKVDVTATLTAESAEKAEVQDLIWLALHA